MKNFLTCKICGYTGQSIVQHLKKEHNINSKIYRTMFGNDERVVINFNPIKKDVNLDISKYIKLGYSNKKEEIKNFKDLYTKEEVYNILKDNMLYKKYIGKTKYRTLIKDDIKLYKSIYEYTNFIPEMYYINPFTLTQRLRLIVEYNYNIESALCKCKRRVTMTPYCRICQGTKTAGIPNPHKEETKRILRERALEYIEKLHGKVCPRYNKKSIEIIEKYGEEHGYNFIHAENGGEYKVIGYFLDAYDPIKNVVLEIDERHHYDIHGNLKRRDIIRQEEIQKFLNCKFIRIRYE